MIEEGSERGEEVAEKGAEFAGFFVHVAQIFVESRDVVEGHAADDAALERGLGVMAEIDSGGFLEAGEHDVMIAEEARKGRDLGRSGRRVLRVWSASSRGGRTKSMHPDSMAMCGKGDFSEAGEGARRRW